MSIVSIESEALARAGISKTKILDTTESRALKTLLLIEDDEELNDVLATRLRRSGLTVCSAFDGPTALEKYRMLEPDLVLLDLGLPRMDGSKLLHFMRLAPSLNPAPILVLTGSQDPGLLRKVEHWGVHTILRKPVSPKAVVQAALDALDGF